MCENSSTGIPVGTAIDTPLLAASSLANSLRLALDWARRKFRTSEGWVIGLALAVGALAGLLTVVQGEIARGLQSWFYGLSGHLHLSAAVSLSPTRLLLLPAGGLLLGLFTLLIRARRRALVDAVEANALHGGRMSMRDNLIVSIQTLISNGFGASVGLEAAYAQMGAGVGSHLARVLRLRRSDIRILVGAGAGGAIAAAFGAPLTGAFYAFEIVIGAYSPSALAPVATAALAGVFVAQAMGASPYLFATPTGLRLEPRDYAIFIALGLTCALVAIGLMRQVAKLEQAVGKTRLPDWARPMVGGLLLIPLAMLSPQVLSAGHDALHLDLSMKATLGFVAMIFVLKLAASIVSLGFGFRGGLFFASLFLGALLGSMFADASNLVLGFSIVNRLDASLVGMAALAAAVVGAPLTMAMLVLETTHDFTLTSAVIAAVLVANLAVRQVFGYSFSTWRLHLRGETIKSARDVGWIRTLTAGEMMRKETLATPADLSVADFRSRFPLGSATRVVLEDAEGRYAGIVAIAAAYADGVNKDAAVIRLAHTREHMLAASQHIGEVMKAFDAAQTDELAVVDADHRVLGVLSEAFVRRRYAEELEKKQREMFGERVDGQ